MKKVVIALLTGLFLSGCLVVRREIVPGSPLIDQGQRWLAASEFTSNGEQIYFTAINERGNRVRYEGGSTFRSMMMGPGTNLACASCHAPDGRGGVHTMHMDVMNAPDIRLIALMAGEEDHGGNDSHADEHGEYDLETFRLAVVDGTHPDGEPLSREMPRWNMDDGDLSDLFDYLKSLP